MIAKEGVDLRDLSAPAWWAAHVADQLHRKETGEELTVTSTGEGKHEVPRSQHYRGRWPGYGRAFDLRIWFLEDPQRFAGELLTELGDEYVVILEKSHIHVHWSPTRG